MSFQAPRKGYTPSAPIGSIMGFQNSHLKHPIISLEKAISGHIDTAAYFIIDSEAAVEDINTRYGAGAATIKGSPTFVAGRGMKCNATGDGVFLNMSIIDPTGNWRTTWLNKGQMSVYFQKEFLLDNFATGTTNLPTDDYSGWNNGIPGYENGSGPTSVGLPDYKSGGTGSSSDFQMILGARTSTDNTAIELRTYYSDAATQVANGLAFCLQATGIGQSGMAKLHSMEYEDDPRTVLALTASWSTNNITTYLDGIQSTVGGPGRSAIAPTLALSEQTVISNKSIQSQVEYIAIGGRATTTSTISFNAISDTGNDIYVYAVVLGKEPVERKIHPMMDRICTYGDSFCFWGGADNSSLNTRSGHWNAANTMQIVKMLNANGYHTGNIRTLNQGGHTIGYRTTYGALPATTQQGVCPDHGYDHLEVDLKGHNGTLVLYHSGRTDEGSKLQGVTTDAIMIEWSKDYFELIRKLLLSGARVALLTYQGSPYSKAQGLIHWRSIEKISAVQLTTKDWVRANMGDYYADRIAVVDVRPYFANYLNTGDTDGYISASPNYLYQPDGGSNGTGIHPIFGGRRLETLGMIDAIKQLTGLE